MLHRQQVSDPDTFAVDRVSRLLVSLARCPAGLSGGTVSHRLHHQRIDDHFAQLNLAADASRAYFDFDRRSSSAISLSTCTLRNRDNWL